MESGLQSTSPYYHEKDVRGQNGQSMAYLLNNDRSCEFIGTRTKCGRRHSRRRPDCGNDNSVRRVESNDTMSKILSDEGAHVHAATEHRNLNDNKYETNRFNRFKINNTISTNTLVKTQGHSRSSRYRSNKAVSTCLEAATNYKTRNKGITEIHTENEAMCPRTRTKGNEEKKVYSSPLLLNKSNSNILTNRDCKSISCSDDNDKISTYIGNDSVDRVYHGDPEEWHSEYSNGSNDNFGTNNDCLRYNNFKASLHSFPSYIHLFDKIKQTKTIIAEYRKQHEDFCTEMHDNVNQIKDLDQQIKSATVSINDLKKHYESDVRQSRRIQVELGNLERRISSTGNEVDVADELCADTIKRITEKQKETWRLLQNISKMDLERSEHHDTNDVEPKDLCFCAEDVEEEIEMHKSAVSAWEQALSHKDSSIMEAIPAMEKKIRSKEEAISKLKQMIDFVGRQKSQENVIQVNTKLYDDTRTPMGAYS